MSVVLRTIAATALLLSVVLPSAAKAQTCAYAPDVVALSSVILDKRPELSRFVKRAHGAEPAFLMIRYGDLGDREAESLLARLLEDDARYTRDLAFAWSYGKEEGAATARLLGDDAVAEALATGGISAVRAMLRGGAEEELIEAVAALDGGDAASVHRQVVIAAVDLADNTKLKLARLALGRDMTNLAAGLIATLAKSGVWDAFAERLGDPPLASDLTRFWRWAPATVGNPELPQRPGDPPPFDPEARKDLHDIMIAAAMEPQFDFLLTIVNQTGLVREVAEAAAAVRAAIADGTVDRDGTLDRAWIIAYDALREVWDDAGDLHAQLSSFQLDTGREGRRTPLDVLDWIIAADTLTPFLRKVVDEPPAMPAELSSGFQATWPLWVSDAAAIRDDPKAIPPTADEAALARGAELLFAAGEYDALAELLEAAPARSDVVGIARDMAIRLDRMCGSYLAHPTEAMQLAGLPIFKFEE